MKDKADLEVKRLIYDLISKNPGLTASNIAKLLNISWELTNYHLNFLEKNNLVTVDRTEGFNRCFPVGDFGVKDRKIIPILRQKIPLSIVIFLINAPFSRFKEISGSINVSPTTLSYHIKKLVKKNIIGFDGDKKLKKYFVKDKEYIIKILIKYKPYSLIDDYDDMWNDFSWKKDLFK